MKKKPGLRPAYRFRHRPKPGAGVCFSCGVKCDTRNRCYGCHVYVCEKCDLACGEYGPIHSPESHLVAPREDR